MERRPEGQVALHDSTVARMPVEGRIAEALVARLRATLAPPDDDLDELARESQAAASQQARVHRRPRRETAGGSEDLRSIHRDERVDRHGADERALGGLLVAGGRAIGHDGSG